MGKYNFNWKDIKKNIKKDEEESQQFGDKRFWKFQYDEKTKKGQALIRFLPDKEGTPYKKYFSHWFRYEGPRGTQYYTDNCATSIGGSCPVCEKNRELFNSSFESDKDIGRDRKRRIHYVSNILILNDPTTPENNGKVFLFDFGPQIFEKYHTAMFGPEDEDEDNQEDLFMPCDFKNGADFILKAVLKKGSEKLSGSKGGFPTYEKSTFKELSKIFDHLLDEDEWESAIDEVMNKTVLVSEWSDPKKFPSDSQVRAKLSAILGASDVKEDEEVPPEDDIPFDSFSDDEKKENPEKEEQEDDPDSHSNEAVTDEEFMAGLIDDK